MVNKILVKSRGNKISINASSDMSSYYSELSKKWAVSTDIVNNQDYSAKYYANKSKDSANEALQNVENAKINALNDIEENTEKKKKELEVQVNNAKDFALEAKVQAETATDNANETISALSTRANVDLSNLSEVGLNKFAGFGLFDTKADTDLSNTTPSQVFKDISMGWGIPDYASGITIPNGYTAPCAGWVSFKVTGGPKLASNIYVNGVTVIYWSMDGVTPCDRTATCYVSKGDYITFSGSGSSQVRTFYPLKGASI